MNIHDLCYANVSIPKTVVETGFIQKHENEIPGLFQDNSRTFSVFKDSI